MHGIGETLHECRDCGLLQRLGSPPPGAVLVCGRCGARLRKRQDGTRLLAMTCACLGLALFALASTLPLSTVVMKGGRFAASDLFTGPRLFLETGWWELAIAVIATLVVLPLVKFTTFVALLVADSLGYVPHWLRRAFAAVPGLAGWGMIEVFMLGAMIALVRLEGWMRVEYGPALFALGAAALCSLALDRSIDGPALWSRIAAPSIKHTSTRAISCLGCGLVSWSRERERCPRCTAVLDRRKPDSIRRGWALVIAAMLLAVPANILPIMSVSKLGEGGPKTIVGGTIELVQRGYWPLAIIVFLASVLVPFLKLGALSALLVTTQRSSRWRLKFRTRLFRAVATIGRWSMVDIFAMTMLVTSARFSWVGSVLPGPAASAFCGVVLLTMVASESFDPRLMWDAAGQNGTDGATPARIGERRG